MAGAVGTTSRSNPNRFAPSTLTRKFTPVTLPPGRLRLATKPILTGSPPQTKRTGIVAVAALAASGAGPPVATINATRR